MEIIKAIYDNEGETLDRYIVILHDGYALYVYILPGSEEPIPFLDLSDDPDHPPGVCLYSRGIVEGEHLGKKITIDELPEKVRLHLIERLKKRENRTKD